MYRPQSIKVNKESNKFKNKEQAINAIDELIKNTLEERNHKDEVTAVNAATLCDRNNLENLAKTYWELAGDAKIESNPQNIYAAMNYYKKVFGNENDAYEHIGVKLQEEGSKAYLYYLTESLDVPDVNIEGKPKELFQDAIYAYKEIELNNQNKRRINDKIKYCEKWLKLSKDINPIKLEKFTKYTQNIF